MCKVASVEYSCMTISDTSQVPLHFTQQFYVKRINEMFGLWIFLKCSQDIVENKNKNTSDYRNKKFLCSILLWKKKELCWFLLGLETTMNCMNPIKDILLSNSKTTSKEVHLSFDHPFTITTLRGRCHGISTYYGRCLICHRAQPKRLL